jgi:hypothetical protein
MYVHLVHTTGTCKRRKMQGSSAQEAGDLIVVSLLPLLYAAHGGASVDVTM